MTHKKNIWPLLLIAVLWLTFGPALPALRAQSGAVHIPPSRATEGMSLRIKVRVEGMGGRVQSVTLFYRQRGQSSYRNLLMQDEFDGYVAQVPGRSVTRPGLQYFFAILMEDQSLRTSPEFNPYGGPYEVEVFAAGEGMTAPPPVKLPAASPQAGGEKDLDAKLEDLLFGDEPLGKGGDMSTQSSDYEVLSPDPDQSVSMDEVVIAVALPADAAIPAAQLHLYLDGREVSSYAEISDYLVSYTPASIQSGQHTAQLEAIGTDGKRTTLARWSFRVRGTSAAPGGRYEVRGRMFADFREERISNRVLGTKNFGANFSGMYGGTEFQGRVFLTSRQRKDQQHRNVFHLGLRNRMVRLGVGDTYPQFNDLVLFGKRVRGIDAGLYLGFINLDLVSGETVRSIDPVMEVVLGAGGTALVAADGTDSLRVARFGTFKQKLFGLRPSFGSGRHFQLGLNFLKVRDDKGSVEQGVNPKDNLVIGPDLRIAMFGNSVLFTSKAAISFLTDDISSGPLSKAKIDSAFGFELPFDPSSLEKYLIINTSTSPLDPTQMTSLAYDAGLRLITAGNFLTIKYRSVGGAFRSLGTSFLRTDLRGLTVVDRFRLWRNQLFLNLTYEALEDNFTAGNSLPVSKINRFDWGFTIVPGPSMPKLTLGMRSYLRDNGAAAAANGVDNASRNMLVQVVYDFRLANYDHSLFLNLNSLNRTDNINPLADINNNVTIASLRSRFDFPLTTTLSYMSNRNKSMNGDNIFNFSVFTLRGAYDFDQRGLKTFVEAKLSSGSGGLTQDVAGVPTQVSSVDYTKNTFSIGGMWRFLTSNVLMAEASLIKYSNRGQTNITALATNPTTQSFDDSVLRIRYERTFSLR